MIMDKMHFGCALDVIGSMLKDESVQKVVCQNDLTKKLALSMIDRAEVVCRRPKWAEPFLGGRLGLICADIRLGCKLRGRK